MLFAACASAAVAAEWSPLGADWRSATHCAADVETCDCPGCRAYRARLDRPPFATDDVNWRPVFDDPMQALCDCPGCRAYRERLDQSAFATDYVESGSAFGSVVLAQAAPDAVQPLDVGQTPGAMQSSPTANSISGGDIDVQTIGYLIGMPDFGQVTNANSETVQAAQASPGGSVIPAQLASLIAAPEPGTIMRDVGSSNTITLQRRNTVSYDPHVRGFRYGQVLSRVGGVWSPVRQDLDSPISKLDPSLIEDIAIIPGPYASRYGPGFAFIDIETAATPRYQGGSESHATIGETFHANRGRQHGRATVYGGGSDWGFIGHYGSRTGSDYRSGNNTLIPSSYDNQSFLGQLGFDVTSHSKIEFRYDRLDQNDTEYALQFFDINYLGNDSTSIRYTDVDPGGPFSQVLFDAWYNRTRYNGNDKNPSKAPVVDRVRSALTEGIPGAQYADVLFVGNTSGDRMLTGGRLMGTLGDVSDVHNRIGADYRFEDQEIRENFWIQDDTPPPPSDVTTFSTNLPKSWMNDVGVFDELVLPVSSYWTTTLGVRADIVDSDARASDIRMGGNIEGRDVSQHEALYAFYLINDVALTTNWSSRFGFGHGQRPPTLVERYADGIFLGIIQSGFSRVIGDPNLAKERLWQIDWGLSCEYDQFRGRGTLYNSWVLDFATYKGNVINSPDGARLLYSTNTDLATMAGFELYGEGDLSEYVTLFSAMNYVQGTDQQIDAPLWGVAPLAGLAGVRIHDANKGQTWGAELGLRMVDRQNRAGLIRNVFDPTVLVPIEQPTAGFSTVNLRSYYNYTRNVSFVMGIENLLDKNYLEHLDLRLSQQLAPVGNTQGIPNLPAVAALSPGFTFYTGVEINH